jgi:hypothetical protein
MTTPEEAALHTEIADLRARVKDYESALLAISSCQSNAPNDVVAIARITLTKHRSLK